MCSDHPHINSTRVSITCGVGDNQLVEAVRNSPASSVLIIGYDTDYLAARDHFAGKRVFMVPTKGITRIDNDTAIRMIDLDTAFTGLRDMGLTTNTLINSAAAISGGDYCQKGLPGMGVNRAAKAAKDDTSVTTLPHLVAELGVELDDRTAHRLSVMFLTMTHCLHISKSGQ